MDRPFFATAYMLHKYQKFLRFFLSMKRRALKILLGGIAASILMVAFSVLAANAEDPTGIWNTERGLARVLIAKCAEEFCGTIIALKNQIDRATGRPQTDLLNEDTAKRNRPVIGIRVIIGMKAEGANKWSGQLYNAEDGKTYRGNLMMEGTNILKVEGCIMMGRLCQTQIWARAK